MGFRAVTTVTRAESVRGVPPVVFPIGTGWNVTFAQTTADAPPEEESNPVARNGIESAHKYYGKVTGYNVWTALSEPYYRIAPQRISCRPKDETSSRR